MLSHIQASPLLQPLCARTRIAPSLRCRSATLARQQARRLLYRSGSVRTRAATNMAAPIVQAAAPGTPRTNSIKTDLLELFRSALKTAYPDVDEADAQPILAPCNNPKFGDYQCNNAMPLFAKLKGKEGAPKAPRDVGTAISKALPESDLIEGVSLAGPGFINVKLRKENVAKRVQDMLKSGVATWAPDLRTQRVVIDFSSPNVAKEMHVGHLRSTIIGDTLARSLEFCGADVLRLNHIGDWGTQFGMLIQHMSEMRPEGLGEEGGREEDVADLQVLYKASKARFDAEPDFKTRARERVTALQSGDPACLAAWRRICEASRREFQAIYDRLGIVVTERGESFYNPMLKDVVGELKEKGVAVESDGAMCVFVEGKEIPLIVQKSDGGYGYASTDMAAVKQRVERENADWVIYVTDCGQAEHFEMVFAAAKRAGWLEAREGVAKVPKLSHVGFGLVLGEDGKKFKTRSGDTVRLVELLDEAQQRCRASITERRKEAGEEVVEAEVEAAASAMGYGAVKYADLKNHRMTNYRFSFDAMLDMKGNTAVYLLYAHARIAGIVRKAGKDMEALAASEAIVVEAPREMELALHICKFPEAIEEMLEDLLPNRLTDYLYELSDKFNSFYVDCKVIGSEQEASRLLLCEATAVVMRQCFALLGITPLYRI